MSWTCTKQYGNIGYAKSLSGMTHIAHKRTELRLERIGGEQIGGTGRSSAFYLYGDFPCQSLKARPLLLVFESGYGTLFLRVREAVSEGTGLQDVSDAHFGCDGVRWKTGGGAYSSC